LLLLLGEGESLRKMLAPPPPLPPLYAAALPGV
jgi:hypothetical protein